jgi:serine/threonine protein kinase
LKIILFFVDRELDIIKRLQHPNIVSLLKYFYTTNEYGEDFLSLVLEYLPTSLDKLLKPEIVATTMTTLAIQRIMIGFFKALEYLHSLGICHRDIKPHNLLVDLSTDRIKLCDFGCAKGLQPNEPNIQYICARYYRAPEIALGWSHYSTQIDLWSAGCVFAEMLRYGKPLFTGKNSVDQWGRILKLFGPASSEELVAMGQEPRKKSGVLTKSQRLEALRSVLPLPVNQDALNLLSDLLEYNPQKRTCPTSALKHPFLVNQYSATSSSTLPHPQKEINADKDSNTEKSTDKTSSTILSFMVSGSSNKLAL